MFKFKKKEDALCFLLLLVLVLIYSIVLYFINKPEDYNFIAKDTYYVHAKAYEYGTVAVDKAGNQYNLIDPPEYAEGTNVIIVLASLGTKDRSDDVIVYIDEEEGK